MRIECPACGAAYEVPEHLLTRPDGTPARPVRCLRCGQEWQPAAQAPESPPSPPASPSRAEAAGPAVPQPVLPARHAAPTQLQPGPAPAPVAVPDSRGTMAPLLAWAASLVLLAVVLAVLVLQREAVMAAWPPATHLFHALGLR
ncbi:zinc-ribbon domain-containing protein [Teichococcus wenyumeiae]|nr:zinc-ribbon domain-containing protein [Pseudoroseomonas wenyumeiae]